MDATVCDAYIKFPTDLGLLNESREKAEELLNKLLKTLGIKKDLIHIAVLLVGYLNVAKKRKKVNQKFAKNSQTIRLFKAGHQLYPQNTE